MALRLRSANRQLMREINASIVLGLVREHGPISRAQIARSAGLSAATVTGITTELMARSLVYEDVAGASTGGRRPILLAFNRGAGRAMGVKITERRLVFAITDLGGDMLGTFDIDLPEHVDPETVVGCIAEGVERCSPAPIGLGVGIAGVVDRPSGTCRYSPFLRWRDVPLRAMLQEGLGIPVIVENDVNTLTHAFRSEAGHRASSSFAVVTVGRGIGLGMLFNGQTFRGARGQGGEFGHITMDADGPMCECGKQGCLEAVVSIPALVRDAERLLNSPIAETDYRAEVEAENPFLADSVEQAATVLGRSLATLVNILNPETLVLSGEGAWFARLHLSLIERALHRETFDGLARQLHLRVEARDDSFWAKGAAALLLEDVFTPQLERNLADRLHSAGNEAAPAAEGA